MKSSGGTTVHIDAVRLLKVSDTVDRGSEKDAGVEEAYNPLTIKPEKQVIASKATLFEENIQRNYIEYN